MFKYLILVSQIIHVFQEKTARNTWSEFKSIHEHACVSCKSFLLRKLYSITYDETVKNADSYKFSVREFF